MAGFPQGLPPGLMGGGPPGAPPPGGMPPMPPRPGMPPGGPMGQMAQARPQGGGGISQSMLMFLAGQGFKQFVDAMTKLRGDKGGGKGKQDQGGQQQLLQSLMASRAMPQASASPPAGASPALLGNPNSGFLGLLANLAAMANRGGK